MASLTDGHEFEQALGVGDGQGGLVYCSSWGRKESDSLCIGPEARAKYEENTVWMEWPMGIRFQDAHV